MKTVSTKLTKENYEKFQEMCNDDGMCMSEELRDLIKMGIDAYEEGLEIKQEESKQTEPIPTIKLIEDEKPIAEVKNARIVFD